MRTIIIMLLAICFATPGAQAIDLQTAMKNKTIQAELLSKGGHRGACIKLNIANQQPTTVIINIVPGTYLANTDTNYQDIILVDEVRIVLKPTEQKTILLNGLCCKRSRRCPQLDQPFALRQEIDSSIAGLCNLIRSTKEFEYAGQEAMWSLVDKTDPNEIVGEDSSNTMALRKFVADALHIPVKPFIWTSYNRPAQVIANELTINTQGNYHVRNVQANDIIEYGVYDATDSAVSVIGKAIAQENRWNRHNVVWNIALEHLDLNQKCYFRIRVNGVVQKEWLYYFWA